VDQHEYVSDRATTLFFFRLSAFVSSLAAFVLIRSRWLVLSAVVCLIPLGFFAKSAWSFFDRYQGAVRSVGENGQDFEFVRMGFTRTFISQCVVWWDAIALAIVICLSLWQMAVVFRLLYQVRKRIP
jgi:hypothetical protein